MRRGRRKAALTLAATLAIAAGVCAPSPALAATGDGRDARPNVLLILTDDQTLSSFRARYMPSTFRHIVRRGTWFTEAIAAPPLCCPARAGILTGQYSHNHGVQWQDYADLHSKRNVLPVWLKRAGYRTAFFGKFLNRYTAFAGTAAAPGFDRWFAFHGPTRYQNWIASNGGSLRRFGANRRAYSTTVLTRKTRSFIRSSARRRAPFFAWLAHWAPHGESGPHERCAGSAAKPERVQDLVPFYADRAPRTPAYDAEDVTGKPPAVAALPRLDGLAQRQVDRRWRCSVAALQAVDRGVERLVRELRATGQLANTVLVFASENGFLFGDHRITQGKAHFYESVARVPMAIRVPRRHMGAGNRVARSSASVSTVDIATTILALTGASPCLARERCRRVDGRSLRPLLTRERTGWSPDRAIPVTLAHELRCSVYEAVRTPSASYLIDRANPGCGRGDELYDLRADPHQLVNLADSADPEANALRQLMATRLERGVRCSGAQGRSPALPGRPLCE